MVLIDHLPADSATVRAIRDTAAAAEQDAKTRAPISSKQADDWRRRHGKG